MPQTWALADLLRAFPDEEIDRILAPLTDREKAALSWAWNDFWLRPDVRSPGSILGTGQRPPPGRWIWWVNQGGRGSGKSTACMLAFCEDADRLGPGFVGIILAESDEEGRKLIEDPKSGLLALRPPWCRPAWEPTVAGGRLTWPSGAVAHIMSAEKPGKGRGPNFNRLLIDDPPKFGPQAKAIFDALVRAFRLQGHGLRAYIATTPPGDPPPRCPELLEFLLDAQFRPAAGWVYSITESDQNMSNLDDDVKQVLAMYADSPHELAERKGVYDKTAGPKTFAGIDFTRAPIRVDDVPDWLDVLNVSIDPADSGSSKACEVGITAQGLDRRQGVAFVLEDASGLYDSDHWPEAAHDLLDRWASRARVVRFVLEINRGTKDASLLKSREMIRRMQRGEVGIATREIRYVTSRVGKADRAAPLVSPYRMGQVKHMRGLAEVEAQLRRLDATSTKGTDRADAVVHGLLDLFGLLDHAQGVALGGDQSTTAGAFGQSRTETIAVAPAERPFSMAAPGPAPSAGAFGRALW